MFCKLKHIGLKFALALLLATQSYFTLNSQTNSELDSLKTLLKTEKKDTSRVLLLNAMVEASDDPQIWTAYNNELVSICEENLKRAKGSERDFYFLYLASGFINRGYLYNSTNNFDNAIKEYLKASKLLDQVKNKTEDAQVAEAYLNNNISAVYKDIGKEAQSFAFVKRAVKLFENVNDEDGIAMACSNLAGHYSDIGKMDTALMNYERSIGIYRKQGNNDGIATIYNNIADVFDKRGNIKEAIEYYKKAYDLIKESNNKTSIAYVLQNIGICYGESGNIKIGLEYLFKGLRLFEELKDKKGIYYALSNIGGIYYRDDDLKAAEEYFLKSIEATKEINYVNGIAASYYRLGNIEARKDNIEKANDYYAKAISLSEKSENYRMLINSLNSLAALYRKQNRTDSAIATYKRSVVFANKAQFKLGKASAIVSLADIYFSKEKVTEAKKLAEEGFKLSKEIGHVVEIKNVANLLYKVYKTTGDNNKALEMHELFVKMDDSLKTDEAQKAIIRSQLDREYSGLKAKDSLAYLGKDRANNEVIFKKDAQLRKSEMFKYTLMFASVILCIIAFIVYRNYSKKKAINKVIEKQNVELEAKNREKELLMHEIHHRVKNNLQIVSSLLKMPQKNIQDTEALEVMDDSRQRIHSISLIHKLLYEKGDLTHIVAKEYVDELCNAVLKSFTLPDQKVNLKLDINDVKMEVDQFLPLALILNELLLNSIKYAFEKVKDPEIIIHLERKEDQIIFGFSDNGMEDASDLIKAKNSFGTKMIFSLTDQLNGLIDVYFKNGTNISITFDAA